MTDNHKQSTELTSEADEGFLSRWSRLKQHARDEQDIPQADDAAAASRVETPAAEPVYLPSDEDMPPIASLDEDSDYTGFMSPRVSEELRKLALRKLFQTPAFHFRDGLDDYDEDFTRFTPLGDTITADMKFQLEKAELKQQADAAMQAEAGDTEARLDENELSNAENMEAGQDADSADLQNAVTASRNPADPDAAGLSTPDITSPEPPARRDR